ncbi:hypothetical protein [Streptomyces sp. NPDC004726]
MTVDGLTAPVPEPLTADCTHCHRPTHAPIPIRWTEHSLHYACPQCAPHLTPGPTPNE